MIKVKIKHLETEQEFSMQGTKEEADAYIARMKVKYDEDKLKISKSDSEKNKAFHNELAKENRAKEYQKIDSLLMEALAEQAEGKSLKMKEYQLKREKIKVSFPYKE